MGLELLFHEGEAPSPSFLKLLVEIAKANGVKEVLLV